MRTFSLISSIQKKESYAVWKLHVCYFLIQMLCSFNILHAKEKEGNWVVRLYDSSCHWCTACWLPRDGACDVGLRNSALSAVVPRSWERPLPFITRLASNTQRAERNSSALSWGNDFLNMMGEIDILRKQGVLQNCRNDEELRVKGGL